MFRNISNVIEVGRLRKFLLRLYSNKELIPEDQKEYYLFWGNIRQITY